MTGDKTLLHPNNTTFYSLFPSPDGNFIVAGSRYPSNNEYKAVAAKIDTTGNVLWEKYYGSGQRDFFFDMEINKNGNPLFFGTTNKVNQKGFYIVETDWDGVVLSEKVIPSPNGGWLAVPHPRMEVLKLQDNGFLITADGSLGSCSDDNSQLYWLDSDANYYDDIVYGTTGQYETLYNSIQLPDENLLSIGGFYGLGGTDLLLVKFQNKLPVNSSTINFENEAPIVYPNPFTQGIHLDLPVSIEPPILLEITDLHGKTLHSESITQNKAYIKADNLGAGLYFLRLQAKNWNQTMKIIKL